MEKVPTLLILHPQPGLLGASYCARELFLKAAVEMGSALGENVSRYSDLLQKGTVYLENELYDGEYFFQKVTWEGLDADDPVATIPDSVVVIESAIDDIAAVGAVVDIEDVVDRAPAHVGAQVLDVLR